MKTTETNLSPPFFPELHGLNPKAFFELLGPKCFALPGVPPACEPDFLCPQCGHTAGDLRQWPDTRAALLRERLQQSKAFRCQLAISPCFLRLQEDLCLRGHLQEGLPRRRLSFELLRVHVPVRTIRTTAFHSPPAILAAHPALELGGLDTRACHGACSRALKSSHHPTLATAAMYGSSQLRLPSTPDWSRDWRQGELRSTEGARTPTAPSAKPVHQAAPQGCRSSGSRCCENLLDFKV